MKNNKLIAEFMGVKPLHMGGSVEYEIYGILDFIEDGIDEQHFFLEEELKFHSSWDWLMPVIDKISGIKNWSINATLDWLSASEFNIQQESDGFYTIEDVYLAVVEFIKLTNLKQQ